MDIRIRPVSAADADACGRIAYEAFRTIAERHDFPPDFPTEESARFLVSAFVADPNVFGVVAEDEAGRVVGSNFLTEYNPVRAVGPITVDPRTQARGIGRRLMRAVIERGRDAAGVRLVQDAFNSASLSLYAALGFDVREPLAMMNGRVEAEGAPGGCEVRPLREQDLGACSDLCRRVHGFERTAELKATPPAFTSFVCLRGGRLRAYASAPHFWALNHAVAETEEDMQALLSGVAAASSEPLSFLLATRQAGLFRWCLKAGLRVVKPMTLMTMGEYREPRGAYLPSVGY